MKRSLRIAIADDEAEIRQFFQKILQNLGHEVVAESATGAQLVEKCRALHPDLVIADIRMPDLDGLAAAEIINKEEPIPFIIVSGHPEDEFIERAGDGPILAFLVKPIKERDLAPAITLAMRRFEQFQALRREASDLRQALENRKVIERAKGIVMRRIGVDEQEAFRRLKKLASDQNRKLVEVARTVLAAEEVFHPMDAN